MATTTTISASNEDANKLSISSAIDLTAATTAAAHDESVEGERGERKQL